MLARLGAAAVVSAALAAPAANAAVGLIVVKPGSPVVGQRSTIELRASVATMRKAPIVQLVSPTHVTRDLRLDRVGSGRWRVVFEFPDDGTWTIRVLTGAVASPKGVQVVQNATPFAPKPSATGVNGVGSSNGIGVIPRFGR
jgi:hypothetical protein